MPINEEVLEDAKKALVIRDVFFRDESVQMSSDITPPFLPDDLKTQFKMVTRIRHDFEVVVESDEGDEKIHNRFLEIEFTGAVRCLKSDSAPDDAPALSMTVSIGLLYQVTHPCSDESVDEFVRMNAPYHAIPYWREHVHSTCAKRRFPTVTVPMYHRAIRVRDRQVDKLAADPEKPTE